MAVGGRPAAHAHNLFPRRSAHRIYARHIDAAACNDGVSLRLTPANGADALTPAQKTVDAANFAIM